VRVLDPVTTIVPVVGLMMKLVVVKLVVPVVLISDVRVGWMVVVSNSSLVYVWMFGVMLTILSVVISTKLICVVVVVRVPDTVVMLLMVDVEPVVRVLRVTVRVFVNVPVVVVVVVVVRLVRAEMVRVLDVDVVVLEVVVLMSAPVMTRLVLVK